MKSTRFQCGIYQISWNPPNFMKSAKFQVKSTRFHVKLPDFMKSINFRHEICQISPEIRTEMTLCKKMSFWALATHRSFYTKDQKKKIKPSKLECAPSLASHPCLEVCTEGFCFNKPQLWQTTRHLRPVTATTIKPFATICSKCRQSLILSGIVLFYNFVNPLLILIYSFS